jgi:hypothetical protein
MEIAIKLSFSHLVEGFNIFQNLFKYFLYRSWYKIYYTSFHFKQNHYAFRHLGYAGYFGFKSLEN